MAESAWIDGTERVTQRHVNGEVGDDGHEDGEDGMELKEWIKGQPPVLARRGVATPGRHVGMAQFVEGHRVDDQGHHDQLFDWEIHGDEEECKANRGIWLWQERRNG